MNDIKEGFYTVHWRDEDFLCYVYRREGQIYADSLKKGTLPVLPQSQGHQNYILLSNLTSVSPDQHLDDALGMIKFIYQNQGRLQGQSRLEDAAQITE